MLTRPNLILNTQQNSVQTEILFLIRGEITKITESGNNEDSLIQSVVWSALTHWLVSSWSLVQTVALCF